MTGYVPVPWVSPLLYGAVLLGGLYYLAAGLGDGPGLLAWPTAGFVAGLAALSAVEWAGRRRSLPRLPLLLAQCALTAAVVVLDASELSRVLFVLLPFTAYFAFGRTAALAFGALCPAVLLTGYLLTSPGWYRDVESVSDLLMLGVGLVLALSMASVAVGEQRARREVQAYAARVAELSAATERNRLARDIHDSLGHHLTAISVQLEIASEFGDMDPGAAGRALAEARESVRLALGDVRQSVRALREEVPRPALSAAFAGWAREGGSGPRVTVEVTGEEDGYETAALTAMYRAAQEGLTNALRHARASRVSVDLRLTEDAARLTVTDDGRGFAPAETTAGFGLTGMRERVHLVAGSVDIDTRPGQGTRLTVVVPRRGGER
ncbi:signal transduction histidine kinase [Streptomyces sp. SAI-133]|uniref:sensor histidine kinase n=1 Tax=unclassified Streptomyces TaxID=2593676 RepID=UPI002473DF59|nr:sensor histidine kinase [Streptomyces sp. SAI-133]MDH6589700.1 signal transduction histidine kinase [Streptomyces sp. SAI-133]